MMERQSRIAVFQYIKGNFWLLIFPLIRGLAAVKFDVYHWLRGAYLDIIVIFAVFGFAYLRWKSVQFKMSEKGVLIREGIFFCRETKLNFAEISCIKCRFPIWLAMFKSGIIEFETDVPQEKNRRGKGEFRLIVSATKCTQYYNNLPINKSRLKVRCEISKMDLIIFSVLFSSTLSGIIFLGTVLIQGGRLLDERAEEKILSAVNGAAEAVEKIGGGITPLAAMFVLVAAAGWLLSFFRNLIRHLNFRLCRQGDGIFVENGCISKWKYYVNYSRINYADLRQNLLMKIFKIMSVHVNCSGYGDGNRLSVFVPITRRGRVISTMRAILPDFTLSNIQLRPKKSYAAYLWLPIVLCVLVPACAEVTKNFLPKWEEAVNLLAVVLGVPAVHLFFVRLTARLSSGIGVGSHVLTARYCRGTRFHTVIVPRSRVAYIRLRQSVFQRGTGVCDVWVCTRGEHAVRHRVRGLDYAEARQFASDFCDTG